MDVGVIACKLFQTQCIIIAVDIFLGFKVVNETVVGAFGNDKIFQIEEVIDDALSMFWPEFFVSRPFHVAKIEAIKVIVHSVLVEVIAVDTIVKDVDKMAESQAGSFD